MPSEAFLDEYYSGQYGNERNQHLSNRYLWVMKKRAEAQFQLIKLKKSLMGVKTALDFGAGLGYLSKKILDNDISVVAVENDSLMLPHISKNNVSNIYSSSEFLSNKSINNSFDLICLSHVAEHLADIDWYMHFFRSKLSPIGSIFLEVPSCNKSSIVTAMDDESHLHFHSVISLKKLLIKAGFTIEFCSICGPTELQLAKSRKAINKPLSLYKKTLAYIMPNKNKSIDTVYDGYYSHYSTKTKNSGIWIRCIAKSTIS